MKTQLSLLLPAVLFLSSAVSGFCGEGGWTTNYAKAVEQAKSQNKAILLDFTGSDWCGWCMKMKRETLDKPQFRQYAEKNLVLVEVDFPHTKPQSDTVKAQNQDLSQRFQITGYPSFVLLDKDGKELGRQGGYLEGGPQAFITKLGTFYKPAASNSSSNGTDDFTSFFKKPVQNPTP